MGTYYQDINNAITTMHYNYGKGDITHIRRFADGRIEIDAKRTSCIPHTSRGHIITNGAKSTIKIYGHQKTVTII